MRNAAASYWLCSCRANAVQQSGNPAAAAPPSNAQVSSFPTHPTLRHSTRAPRPCLSLLLPASLPSPARLHNVCASRATPRKPALARSPLPHASTPRPVALAPPSLPRPACPRTSARPSVAISSSPLPPLHTSPRTSGPRPIPRAPFLSAAVAAGRSNASPDRRTAAHSTAGPLGRRRPGRRGPRPARSFRVAADQPARATAALVLEDDEDNAPLFRERSWKRGRKIRYTA